MIDLRSLRYSILAADYQSFRKAALAIGVGQPTLSRRIRSLEDTIGVSVFERHSGGVRLTHAGVVFIKAVRKAVKEIDTAISTAELTGGGQIGRLNVGFYTSLSKGKLRRALIEFVRRYPEVTVETVEAGRERPIAALETKALDIIVMTRSSELVSCEDSLVSWDEGIMLALPEWHPLAEREAIYWSDLKGQQCLLMRRDPGPELRAQIGSRLKSPDGRPDVVQYDVSLENLLNLVASSGRVALVYECATGMVYSGVVYRELHEAGGPSRIVFYASWKQGNDNPALRRFLSLLRTRYSARSAFTSTSGNG